MLSNTQAAAAAEPTPMLIHTDVAWQGVAAVTHSHQQLQHLMNIN